MSMLDDECGANRDDDVDRIVEVLRFRSGSLAAPCPVAERDVSALWRVPAFPRTPSRRFDWIHIRNRAILTVRSFIAVLNRVRKENCVTVIRSARMDGVGGGARSDFVPAGVDVEAPTPPIAGARIQSAVCVHTVLLSRAACALRRPRRAAGLLPRRSWRWALVVRRRICTRPWPNRPRAPRAPRPACAASEPNNTGAQLNTNNNIWSEPLRDTVLLVNVFSVHFLKTIIVTFRYNEIYILLIS